MTGMQRHPSHQAKLGTLQITYCFARAQDFDQFSQTWFHMWLLLRPLTKGHDVDLDILMQTGELAARQFLLVAAAGYCQLLQGCGELLLKALTCSVCCCWLKRLQRPQTSSLSSSVGRKRKSWQSGFMIPACQSCLVKSAVVVIAFERSNRGRRAVHKTLNSVDCLCMVSGQKETE